MLDELCCCISGFTDFAAAIVFRQRLVSFVAKASLLAQTIASLLMIRHRTDSTGSIAESDFEMAISQCQSFGKRRFAGNGFENWLRCLSGAGFRQPNETPWRKFDQQPFIIFGEFRKFDDTSSRWTFPLCWPRDIDDAAKRDGVRDEQAL